MAAARSESTEAHAGNPEVGLVLAGGGARGAYEIGALSVLLPALEQRGERPGVVLGTSIGALNASFLGATAQLSTRASIEAAIETWQGVAYDDVLGPLVSARTLGRLLRYFGLLGVRSSTVDSLLDTAPLAPTLRELVAFDQIGSNVDAGALASVAVVATSYAKGDSVVFHHSRPKRKVPDDLKRAIRYEPTRLTDMHVQASSAIPVAFPAIRVDKPTSASGWYGDGGTRLNTPIKPALKLGAKRVVVIGLTSSAPPKKPVAGRPDIFDGAGQIVQALLSDQLTQDVWTLTSRNRELAAKPTRDAAAEDDLDKLVPYILVAPRDRLTIGRLAADIYRKQFTGLRAKVRARDLAALGHIIDAGASPARGELFSVLFFAREFVDALIELGREDAKRWLAATHNDGPWRYGAPPQPATRARTARRGRGRAKAAVSA